ncbi:MAG: phosphatase PAP2 family protein [Patescibacteria group bacterium]|nr:phosphatase PAP2 family protein [Patescibacteria group bacterium]
MQNSLLGLFYRLPQNFAACFRAKNLRWHLLAIVLTVACAYFGLDWAYYKFLHGGSLARAMFPAVILGFLLPVFLPVALLLTGWLKGSARTLNSAFALAQAAFLGWLMSAVYKVVTGRPGPPHGSAVDISRVFNFGFDRGGVFFGWPSSHTTVAFAVGVCLVALYPENKVIKFFGWLLAVYIGVGVSMTIHWLSDFLAGVIFGSLVGQSVGQSFYRRLHQPIAA